MKQTAYRKRTGTVFVDAMIELVAERANENRLKLLSWLGAKVSIQSRVDIALRPQILSVSKNDFHTITFEPEEQGLNQNSGKLHVQPAPSTRDKNSANGFLETNTMTKNISLAGCKHSPYPSPARCRFRRRPITAGCKNKSHSLIPV